MKPPLLFFIPFALLLILPSAICQSLDIEGEAIVGQAGQGNNILTLRSERSWIFRQYSTGATTALELFSTIGLKNFLINTTGNVGVGLLEPSEKLHVNGNIKIDGPKMAFGSSEYINDGGSFLIECNGSLVSTLDNTDFLGSSSRRWNSVYAVNGMINTSDARAKTNISQLTYGLKELMQLRPVSFNWIDRPQDRIKIGLVAQEVQKVLPELVADQETYRDEKSGEFKTRPVQQLGLCYTDFIPILIHSIQEQQSVITKQGQKILELERDQDKIIALENRIEQLERRLFKTGSD